MWSCVAGGWCQIARRCNWRLQCDAAAAIKKVEAVSITSGEAQRGAVENEQKMLRFCHRTGFGVNPVWLKWNCGIKFEYFTTVCQLLNHFIYLLSTCLLFLFSANVIQRLHKVDTSWSRNPELRTNGCYRRCFKGWWDLVKCQLAVLASAKDRKVSTRHQKLSKTPRYVFTSRLRPPKKTLWCLM